MGLYTLTSYDTLECASKCDQADGCEAFNVYVERDPSVDPNKDRCSNPPSITNYKCTLWGAPVAVEEATNKGQYRDDFQVVIAGSNGKSGLEIMWDPGALVDDPGQLTTRLHHRIRLLATMALPHLEVRSMLPSTPRARTHTWDTSSSRSAKAKATTHKLALMRATYKLPITVDTQRWMARIRLVSSSTHTFFRRTLSHKAFTALSTTKRGRPPTPRTTDNTVAPIATPSLGLTATPCQTLQTHQPPHQSPVLPAL